MTPTAWTNAASRIVVPFGVSTRRVHPAGGVMVRFPRTPIAATRTSPCCTPAGTGIVSDVEPFVNAEAAARNWMPGGGVVTGAEGALGAEVLPAASDAVTVYSYVVSPDAGVRETRSGAGPDLERTLPRADLAAEDRVVVHPDGVLRVPTTRRCVRATRWPRRSPERSADLRPSARPPAEGDRGADVHGRRAGRGHACPGRSRRAEELVGDLERHLQGLPPEAVAASARSTISREARSWWSQPSRTSRSACLPVRTCSPTAP